MQSSHTITFPNVSTRQLVVVTTVTPWDEPPRIRHQVTRQLTRFYNVIYVELPMAASSNYFSDHYEKINEHLIMYRPAALPRIFRKIYNNIPFCHAVYNNLIAKKIEKAIRQSGYKNAFLINFQYDFDSVMSSSVFYPRIYFCNDNFPEMAKYKWKKSLLAKYEKTVIKDADCCIVVSVPLQNKLKRINKNVHLLLPGHEFKIDYDKISTVGDKIKKIPISVCYMGYIDQRLSLDWLIAVASSDNFVLYLIGPVSNEFDISPLCDHENFKWKGPVVGTGLQALLESTDVCVMPFNTELEVVQAMTAPNKLFQYIASGKPIVTSDIPDLMKLPDGFIYKARDPQDFSDKILKAYEDDNKDLIKARMTLALQNSWDSRGDALYSIIESYKKIEQ